MELIPNPIPQGQGVYALLHRPTKSLYVGSSTNLRQRVSQWRRELATRSHPRLREYPQGPLTEWTFKVLQRSEGMTHQQLLELEQQVLDSARTRGVPVLNRTVPGTRYNFIHGGIYGSATFHATRLGLNPAGVTEKLRRGYTFEEAIGEEKVEYDWRAAAINAMPVKIIGPDGHPMTYKEVSTLCNRHVETIRAEVSRARRRRDITEVNVQEIRGFPKTGPQATPTTQETPTDDPAHADPTLA